MAAAWLGTLDLVGKCDLRLAGSSVSSPVYPWGIYSTRIIAIVFSSSPADLFAEIKYSLPLGWLDEFKYLNQCCTAVAADIDNLNQPIFTTEAEPSWCSRN